MKTTTLPPEYLAPARPVVPRPPWESHQLFREPEFPEGLNLVEDDEDEGE